MGGCFSHNELKPSRLKITFLAHGHELTPKCDVEGRHYSWFFVVLGSPEVKFSPCQIYLTRLAKPVFLTSLSLSLNLSLERRTSHPPKSYMAGGGGGKTLWVGDLEEWQNEHWILSTFAHAGQVSEVRFHLEGAGVRSFFRVRPYVRGFLFEQCKIIRHRPSGQHAGYGFVEFSTPYEAEQVVSFTGGTCSLCTRANIERACPASQPFHGPVGFAAGRTLWAKT